MPRKNYSFRQNLRFAVALVLGFLRDRESRRQIMFFVTLGAVVSLAAGATILEGFLTGRPWIFLLYWGGCLWLTLAALLLALYDMAMTRRDFVAEKKRLARGLGEVLHAEEEQRKEQ